MSKEALNFIKSQLGYTDEEMELWLKNPRNQEAILKIPALLQKTVPVYIRLVINFISMVQEIFLLN
jgi:hypothetical protein